MKDLTIHDIPAEVNTMALLVAWILKQEAIGNRIKSTLVVQT